MPFRPYWGKAGAGLVSVALAGIIVVLATISTSKTSRELLIAGILVLLILGCLLFILHVGNRPHEDPVQQFTDANPAELMEIARANTAIQSAKILEPHYGKWIRITGPLRDVSPWEDSFGGFSLVTLKNYSGRNWIGFFFNDRLVVENRLAALPAGRQLTILGKITEISTGSITLKECQIEAVVNEASLEE